MKEVQSVKDNGSTTTVTKVEGQIMSIDVVEKSSGKGDQRKEGKSALTILTQGPDGQESEVVEFFRELSVLEIAALSKALIAYTETSEKWNYTQVDYGLSIDQQIEVKSGIANGKKIVKTTLS